jgi:hypothetical protein
VRRGDVAGTVVGHDALHRDAVVGEEAQPPSQEGDRLAAVFAPALEHLGVGEPGVVVDHHVHELPAGRSLALAVDGALDLAAPAGNPVAGATTTYPPEPLDVDVDQLAGAGELVAVGRFGRALAASACQVRSA